VPFIRLVPTVAEVYDLRWILAALLTCAALVFTWVLRLLSRREKAEMANELRRLQEQIAGYQRSEEKMRQRQDDLHLVFNSIAEGVHCIDRNGNIFFENAAAGRLLGWDRFELIGQPANTVMCNAHGNKIAYPQCKCPAFDCLRTGESRRVTGEVFWRKDGTSLPVEYTITPMKDLHGEIQGAVVVFSDVTERKEAEESRRKLAAELEAERTRLQAILDSVPAVVFDHRIEEDSECPHPNFVSNFVEQMFGFTPREWHSSNDFWFTRVHPEDRKFIDLTPSGSSSKQTFRWLAKDGRIVWGDTHLVFIRNEQNCVVGVRGVTLDVTQQMLALEALRESENRFRALCSSAPIGIFLADTSGNGIYTNPQWQKIAGIDLESSLGLGWKKVVHPEDVEEVSSGWFDAAATGKEFNREFRFQRPSGEIRHVFARTAVLTSENGEPIGYVGTVEDITDRKQSEAQLEDINKKLIDASRRAGMAEIATSVLHNVGNVLNSVNVSYTVIADKVRRSRIASVARAAEMLRKHENNLAAFFTEDPTGRKFVEYFEKLSQKLSEEQTALRGELALLGRNVDHIKEIIFVQQSYAHVGGVSETMPLVSLVEDVLRMHDDALQRHHIEVVREYNEAPPVLLEKHKVLQILVNLVGNAKRALVDSHQPSRKRLVVRIGSNNNHVFASLSDNGVGIPQENMTRIFAYGFTTKSDGHGFGLHSGALAAKEMGGRLIAQSPGPGTGATFTLELPIAGQRANSRQPALLS